METTAGVVDANGKWPLAAAFVIGVLLLAAATRDAALSSRTLGGDFASSTAAYARIVQLSAVLVAATDAETCAHGYVITGDRGFLIPYEGLLDVEATALRKLEALYAGDLERGPLLAHVREALATQRAHMSTTVALRRALGRGDAATLIAGFRGRELTDSLRVAIKVIVTDEQSALSRDRVRLESATLVGTRNVLVFAGSGLLLLTLALGAVIRRLGKASVLPTDHVCNAFDGPVERVNMREGTETPAVVHVGEGGVSRTLKCERGSARGQSRFVAVGAPPGRPDLRLGVHDITTRVTLEEQLRQVRKMQAVGQVGGGIAHAFNDLLGIIGLNAKLLAADGASGVAHGVELKEIRTAPPRGGTMVGQLLRVSRHRMLHRKRVDVGVAVKGFLRIIKGMMPENIRVEAGTLDAGGAAILDVRALEQMLANLCTNARDAMPDGGTISIDCQPHYLDAADSVSHPWVRPGDYICVSVSDTGIGMGEATFEPILEPCSPNRDTGSRTGLGLAMVYGMMRDHEGMVHVLSDAGRGTVVQLYFPVAVTVVQHHPMVSEFLDPPLKAG